MKIERFSSNPVIRPHVDGRMGSNINGPSLIRVPDWLDNPLGRYYLYFAHHHGEYMRLAYADRLEGTWTTYEPGTVSLEGSFCRGHVASPDVHIDDERREIRMYYHGPVPEGGQRSKAAISKDGIHFECFPESLGNSYFRVFRWGEHYYALAMPGVLYRSRNGLSDFEEGPTLFTEDMRHSAVQLCGSTLRVFYTNVGDCPERILLSTINLTSNWLEWRESPATTVLEPAMDYEGTDLPLQPSVRGWAPERVRELRDPAVFQEGNRTYLLYSVAGEHGIAIAKVS